MPSSRSCALLCPTTPAGRNPVRLLHPTGHSRRHQPSERLELFSLLTWTFFVFLPNSHCWCFKEGPRVGGESGKGSHWDGDQHSHECCHACSRRPGQTGTVSLPATSRLFLNHNKRLWLTVYAEPWLCSCLDGNVACVPSVPSAATRGQHLGSHWGPHSSLRLIRCAALGLWSLVSARSSWGLLVSVLPLLKDYFPRNYTKLSNTSVLPGHPKKGPQFSLRVLLGFLWNVLAGVREDNRPTELGRIRQTASGSQRGFRELFLLDSHRIMIVMEKLNPPPVGDSVKPLLRDMR